MKVYQTNEIKNIALLGSSGSGKTTLVEAMLFESGVMKRRGSIAVGVPFSIRDTVNGEQVARSAT